ncbi:MAG: thiamine phosphate synthase [Firmicutes bacterium]|nr:thiamine phosphate synthase [Bacillota bacterium]
MPVHKARLVDALAVYLITDPALAARRGRTVQDVVARAIAGGVTCVQLRAKDFSTRALVELGRELLDVTRRARVPLLVNDRLDVALALGADGVHLGEDDLPIDAARRIADRVAGPGFLIGASADSVAVARRAADQGADYLGVGDVFGTTTKPDAGPVIGIGRLAEIARSVDVPVVGIGGVDAANAAGVIRAGAQGVAVVSAVFAAHDPEASARSLARAVLTERSRPKTKNPSVRSTPSCF